ncbi:hypothetical protein ACVW00_000630 [Marmoricola sp. URHA0025 HA25]
MNGCSQASTTAGNLFDAHERGYRRHMRLALAVLVPALALTSVGLAFAAAVCVLTAAIVWVAYGVARISLEPDRRP